MSRSGKNLRRLVLATLGAGGLFGPAAFSGCAVNFTPPGKIDALRVIAVTTDRPYVPPIDPDACAADATKCTETVNLEMEVYDAYGVNTQGSERPINILWIGGCFDPPGDQYSLCVTSAINLFSQASDALAQAVASGEDPVFPPGLPLGWGKKFSVQVPDIVSIRPTPEFGPHYGIGYVFFLACAGKFGILEADPSAAGNFPIGCFDKDTGEALGADSFVPGYTQFYSFEDGRENGVPEILSLDMDETPMPEDFNEIPVVPACDVPPDERNLPPSCSREAAWDACKSYEIELQVPEDVGEIDPEAEGDDGQPLHEAVWVNYYSDTGDFEDDIKLINDATSGYKEEHQVRWVPPAEPGLSTIWAVVRDARGASNVVVRYVRVE